MNSIEDQLSFDFMKEDIHSTFFDWMDAYLKDKTKLIDNTFSDNYIPEPRYSPFDSVSSIDRLDEFMQDAGDIEDPLPEDTEDYYHNVWDFLGAHNIYKKDVSRIKLDIDMENNVILKLMVQCYDDVFVDVEDIKLK